MKLGGFLCFIFLIIKFELSIQSGSSSVTTVASSDASTNTEDSNTSSTLASTDVSTNTNDSDTSTTLVSTDVSIKSEEPEIGTTVVSPVVSTNAENSETSTTLISTSVSTQQQESHNSSLKPSSTATTSKKVEPSSVKPQHLKAYEIILIVLGCIFGICLISFVSYIFFKDYIRDKYFESKLDKYALVEL